MSLEPGQSNRDGLLLGFFGTSTHNVAARLKSSPRAYPGKEPPLSGSRRAGRFPCTTRRVTGPHTQSAARLPRWNLPGPALPTEPGELYTTTAILSGARYPPHDIAVQFQTASNCPLAATRLGLDDDFLRGVIEQSDSNVRIIQALLEFRRDRCEHFIRVQGRNDVPRNVVQQREVARFHALFTEKP